MNISPQYQAMWDRWVQTLLSHRDLPALQQLFPLFDGLFHLSPDDQNTIISDASNLLGQEIQEYIGSLLVAHNRQNQTWINLNEAASREHWSEALSHVDQASVNSSRENIHAQQLPEMITSDVDVDICAQLEETGHDAEQSRPEQNPTPILHAEHTHVHLRQQHAHETPASTNAPWSDMPFTWMPLSSSLKRKPTRAPLEQPPRFNTNTRRSSGRHNEPTEKYCRGYKCVPLCKLQLCPQSQRNYVE